MLKWFSKHGLHVLKHAIFVPGRNPDQVDSDNSRFESFYFPQLMIDIKRFKFLNRLLFEIGKLKADPVVLLLIFAIIRLLPYEPPFG